MNVQTNVGHILANRVSRYAVQIRTAREWEAVEEIQNKVFELLELAILLQDNHQITEDEGEEVKAAWNVFVESAEAVQGEVA